jgi:hypothetical protein
MKDEGGRMKAKDRFFSSFLILALLVAPSLLNRAAASMYLVSEKMYTADGTSVARPIDFEDDKHE